MKYLKLFESWNYDDVSDEDLMDRLKWLEIERKEIDQEISNIKRLLIQKRNINKDYRNSFFTLDEETGYIKVYENFIKKELIASDGIDSIEVSDNDISVVVTYNPDNFDNVDFSRIKPILDNFVGYLGFDYFINNIDLILTWDDKYVELY